MKINRRDLLKVLGLSAAILPLKTGTSFAGGSPIYSAGSPTLLPTRMGLTVEPISRTGISILTGALIANNMAWPAANRAYFVPLYLPEAAVIDAISHANGGTNTGNLDVGIYKRDGTKIVSSGSTAQSGGAFSYQTITFTATALAPGYYYLAIAADNNTAQHNRGWTGQIGALWDSVGVKQMATAFALPSNATFASNSDNFCPNIMARRVP